MKKQKEIINKETGEIMNAKLNELIIHETIRPNGTVRIQLDYSNCPTMAEQHTAHLTNINYLIEKYKPDELAAYIAARNAHRQEIVGHDFTQEPSLQDAKNVVYNSRQNFEKLPDDIKKYFPNHLEFLKFIDNPANADKMVALGLMTKKQIENIQIEEVHPSPTPQTTTKHEEKDKKA